MQIWSKGPGCKLGSFISLNNNSAALITGCGWLQQGREQKGQKGACREMEGGHLYKTLSKCAPCTWASNISSPTLKMQAWNWRPTKYSIPVSTAIPLHSIPTT